MGPKGTETGDDIVERLKKVSNIDYWNNLRRFSIPQKNSLGIPVPEIRRFARHIEQSRPIAMELWKTGIHEAMILATMVFPPEQLTMEEANVMVGNVDSWDLCDHFTGNLVCNFRVAIEAAEEWYSRDEEFVKRSAFSIIAQLDRKNFTEKDVKFFLECILASVEDERNFVAKAVSWALREIGKSCMEYNRLAMDTAIRISEMKSRSAARIGRTVIKELSSRKVRARLENSSGKD